MSDSNFDIIVVGAGISGLLSALALGKEGKKVLVLEKSGVLGGNCRTYEVKGTGFFVDTGVHAITGLNRGPLVALMEKYFDIVPKFVPHGNYYFRERAGIKKFPNTLQDIARFGIIPRKDRLILTKLLIEAIARGAIFKRNEISVLEYVSKYNLSPITLRLIDSVSYFLSGVSMKDTPVWRVLSGGGLIEDGERRLHKKISEFVNLALNSSYAEQGYPRGGIGRITECIIKSFPKNVEVRLNENVEKIEQKGGVFHLFSSGQNYFSETVVYSGEAKKLSDLIEMPSDWNNSAAKLKQSQTMTLWLGLKKPASAFSYKGSEVWFYEGVPYWAMPTTGYDPHLAPAGGQLVGFTTFMDASANAKSLEKKFLETIYSISPEIEKNIIMKHTQIMTPEKAAVSVGVKFPSVVTPVKNLYLAGTDADMRSMGVTRAAYSVIEMLKAMRIMH